jgi:hypothetical protein
VGKIFFETDHEDLRMVTVQAPADQIAKFRTGSIFRGMNDINTVIFDIFSSGSLLQKTAS